MTDEDDETTLQSFFEKEAAFGLIVQMDPDQGNIKAELIDELVYSERSLGDLLSDAQDVGVIVEAQMRPGDHPRSTRYELTPKGKEIRAWLERLDINELYQQYLEAWKPLDATLSKAQAIIKEEVVVDDSADSWTASGMPSVIPDEEFADDARQRHDPNEEVPHPEAAKSEDEFLEVLDDENPEDEDLGRVETWGNELDEEDEANE
jgi:DNA-binding PadR family transcriptional regulator